MRVRQLALSIAIAASSACVTIPPFVAHKVVGSADEDLVGYSIDGTTEGGTFFRLHFADQASAFHLPDSLNLAGQELLAKNTGGAADSQGAAESLIGIAAYPMFRASADSTSPLREPSSLKVILEGPAVAQVEADWIINTGAGDSPGVSTFTVYPNGRIFRHDTITPLIAIAPGTSTFLTSFVTVDRSVFGLYATAAESPKPWPASTDTFDGPTVCAGQMVDPQTALLGVAWSSTSAVRTRVHSMPSATSAFVFDWARQLDPTFPNNQVQNLTTMIQLAGDSEPQLGNCGAVNLRTANTLVRNPRLIAHQDGGGMPIAIDGTGAYRIEATGGAIELTTADGIEPGFAVVVHAPGMTDVNITGDYENKPEPYLVQHAADDFWIWFNSKLQMTNTITLTLH